MAEKLRPLLIFGTRPEAIKMAPVVAECRRRSSDISAVVCVTGQHKEMLQQVIGYFGIESDYTLDLMRPNQTLSRLTARCIEQLDDVMVNASPDCVVAQGDTTTVLAASIVAFYHRIPFVHVEAGLRTGDLLAPWPEEFNRKVADMVTTLYCAPTKRAADQLATEGVPAKMIRITGNTVIDALIQTLDRERKNAIRWKEKYPYITGNRMVLITGHRRESFGGGFERICDAISILASNFPDVSFVYPVHLNPNVQDPVHRILAGLSNVFLIPPAEYPEFVWLMDQSYILLTDSGGVQEEGPSLKKPILVMRETTERPEAIETGAARLVGTNTQTIVENVSTLLTNEIEYETFLTQASPYGDGHAAKRIVDWIVERPWQVSTEYLTVPA